LNRKQVAELLASHQRLAASTKAQSEEIAELRRQLDWFKRQLFGSKSERRPIERDGRQLNLGEWVQDDAVDAEVTVGEHRRRVRREPREAPDADQLRFSEDVPVEEVRIDPPDLSDEDEVVSEKVTYRLAQKPASYVVLKTVRPVVKRQDGTLVSAPAPTGVLGKSVADVSLLACMAIEKFVYHLPLYRQHQRMEAAGVRLARSTLTGLMQRTGDLLEPIVEAQLASIVSGAVVAMDETPIKAGRKGRGKMQTGYFWPIYGDRDEIVFPFSPSRSGELISELLDGYSGVLLTDGYAPYERYAARVNEVVHAQCWSHARRQFLKAEGVEPELTATALEYIRRLYEAESGLKPRLDEPDKLIGKRARRSKPIVDEFFVWLRKTLDERLLLPRNPFTEAAGYTLERERALRVFLAYPDVPIDTNHLEREIRPIAVGRKNWVFCWTEIGARYVGIFQSLLRTCRLQDVDPYVYLVDVLQRVEQHPASDVASLTPRLWKERFADESLRSAIDRPVNNAVS
jgi:transposase